MGGLVGSWTGVLERQKRLAAWKASHGRAVQNYHEAYNPMAGMVDSLVVLAGKRRCRVHQTYDRCWKKQPRLTTAST